MSMGRRFDNMSLSVPALRSNNCGNEVDNTRDNTLLDVSFTLIPSSVVVAMPVLLELLVVK